MSAPLNLTADGSTTAIQFQGDGTIIVRGNLGGGTLSVESSPKGVGDYVVEEDGTFTATGQKNIRIGPSDVRFTLAGATAPNVDVYFVGNYVRKSSKIG
jgi:hypothetical protein